jgi:hypothetical protein
MVQGCATMMAGRREYLIEAAVGVTCRRRCGLVVFLNLALGCSAVRDYKLYTIRFSVIRKE